MAAARESGQAAVEFALVLVVLLAVLYGILEISRLLLINAEVENAAREGVRYAALHPGATLPSIMDNAVAPRLALIKANDLRLTSTSPMGTAGQYSPIQMRAVYTWTSMVNFMPDMRTLTLRPLGPLKLEASSMALTEGR